MSRIFDDARQPRAIERVWRPAVELRETDAEYTLEADLPGLKREDVELTVHEDVISLKGERKSEKTEDDSGYHRNERYFGTFERTFRVPGGIDAEGVKATFEDGVLKVHIPKPAEAQPKKITVKVK